MFSELDNTCRTLAFAWDHQRHAPANFVAINFRGNRWPSGSGASRDDTSSSLP
jgi:hypothetical protein